MNKKLKVEYKNKVLEGILINETDNRMTLKLISGYNAVLNKNEVSIVETFGISSESKENIVEPKKNNSLPNIKILHTGGTIASKVDYATGAVTSRFTPEELIGLYPELNEIANLSPIMISNLSSEDMNFKHYNLLLNAIKNCVDEGVDGVIISHGTDTMHYTSAALQYACENLPIPVLLVGAQRSSDRASSDAYVNLKAAIEFISYNSNLEKSYNRVGICMHSSIDRPYFNILDGINAKKMHSSRRDAFHQINYSPVAFIDELGSIELVRDDLFTSKPLDQFSITLYDESLKIGFFKAHPNLHHEEISMLSIYDCVIVEGTGLGHIAVTQFDEYTKENPKNLDAVKELVKTTKVIVGVQTVYGQTNMNIYSSGVYLKETGVYGQYMNLITETLFIRAAYCLSKCKENFDDLWSQNLEGFDMRDCDIKIN